VAKGRSWIVDPNRRHPPGAFRLQVMRLLPIPSVIEFPGLQFAAVAQRCGGPLAMGMSGAREAHGWRRSLR